MIEKTGSVRKWSEPILRYYPSITLDKLRKTTQNFSMAIHQAKNQTRGI
jgi:hypothetical protein